MKKKCEMCGKTSEIFGNNNICNACHAIRYSKQLTEEEMREKANRPVLRTTPRTVDEVLGLV